MALSYMAQAEEPVDFPDPNLKDCVEAKLGISDPTPTDMLGLTSLTCQFRGVVNLTGLEYATNLTWLDMPHNQINDISAAAGLTNLTKLELHNNQISDINDLAGLENLTHLNLSNNQIGDINDLAGLAILTGLWLGGNQKISDISVVAKLQDLTHLGLHGNQIRDISAVAGLTKLTYLHLDTNQISDINAVAGLAYLTELHLGSNHITDISAVAGLASLTVSYLGGNHISDISPLTGLTSIEELALGSNPLNNVAYCTHLPSIIAKNPGLHILYYDENKNPPTGVSASNGTYTDKVQITWDAVCSVTGDTYYRVYRSNSEGGTKTPLGIDWQTSRNYDDTTAKTGTIYYYWVKAKTEGYTGAYGETDYSSYDTGWILDEKPTVITLPATDVTETTAMLRGQIDDDGGEPCQYRFKHKKSGGSSKYTVWTGSKQTGDEFSYEITGLDPNTEYCFNAQARNSAGESAWGDEECFVTAYGRISAATERKATDYWATTDAQIYFGDGNIAPIPADFFGRGSDPFDGLICFRGEPIEPNVSLSDIRIRRLEDAILKEEPNSIPIELVGLNLVSTEPIMVTYDGGTGGESFFDVYMTIDPNAPSLGAMTIEGDKHGGMFWFEIEANIALIFVRWSDGEELCLFQPVTMEAESDYPWQNTPPIILVRPPCIDTDFYPSGDDVLTLRIDTTSFQNITHKDPLPMDLDDDDDVDFGDFAEFATRWLVGK